MSHDAIVIGGGIGGLTAAGYLTRAGKRVLLLEAQDAFGGLSRQVTFGGGFSASLGAQALYALDPRVVKDLRLAKAGLKFAARDMPLTGVRADGSQLTLRRDVHATAASIAAHSDHDAKAWPVFRRELFDLATALRALWWEADGVVPAGETKIKFMRLARTGVAAWLDSWFESDDLKAALCFDATAGALSTLEAGSALALVWRAAQEMSGLQGAVAQALAETLITALVAAAGKAELRTGARATEIMIHAERVAGVRLESGETITAPIVFSSASRRRTLTELIVPPAAGIAHTASFAEGGAPTGEACILLALGGVLDLGSLPTPTGRFVIADRPEIYSSAELSARAGDFADELPMEVTIPSLNDPTIAPQGQHVVSVLVRPLPNAPKGGWSGAKPQLAARVVKGLQSLLPDIANHIGAMEIFTPDDLASHSEAPHTTVKQMMAGPISRIETPIRGLLLCGSDAEPIPAVSGRAARIAAMMVLGKVG